MAKKKRKRKGKSRQLVVVTDDGYGHRFPLRDIPRMNRGSYGVKVQGGGTNLAGAVVLFADDEVPEP